MSAAGLLSEPHTYYSQMLLQGQEAAETVACLNSIFVESMSLDRPCQAGRRWLTQNQDKRKSGGDVYTGVT